MVTHSFLALELWGSLDIHRIKTDIKPVSNMSLFSKTLPNNNDVNINTDQRYTQTQTAACIDNICHSNSETRMCAHRR